VSLYSRIQLAEKIAFEMVSGAPHTKKALAARIRRETQKT
jgi:hypothetical protein